MNMRSMVMPMDADDLLTMPEGDNYELVNGYPVEKPMGAKASETTVGMMVTVGAYIRLNKLGHVYDSETGYQCFPNSARTVRKPDMSFVAKGRLPDDKSPGGHIKIAPDLVVETISPNDLYEEVETKVAEYRSAGVRLIWIVSPTSRTVMVRRLDGSCSEVNDSGNLNGEDVVSGFNCELIKIFPEEEN